MSRYAPSPEQRVARPSIISTYFPRLPRRSRTAFGVALIALAAVMALLATFELQAPLIGVVVAGLPLLFLAYLKDSAEVDDLSVRILAITAGLGTVFGVGWALATDFAIARSEPDALGIPVGAEQILITGLAIPMGFLILLIAPVVLLRWRLPDVRNSLDGYAIGALGAFCFTAAGNLTRLAPLFATGVVTHEAQSPIHLVVAAAIQGLAIPLTAAAVAGAVGATLWFTPQPDSVGKPHWYALSSPLPALAFGAAIFFTLGLVDLFALPHNVEMGIYALVAVVSLYVLRIVLHCTVHDAPAETSRPVRRLLVILGAGSALAITASLALALWLTPPEAHYVCPPDCGRPPISNPVATNPRFTPTTGEFSVSYPGEGTAYEATFEPNGVVLKLLAGDGGTLRLFGEPANGRTARQVAEDVIRLHHPNAQFAYEVPNALVGYQLGYGEVADVYPADSIGDDSRFRVMVMVGVKNDYALIAAAAGPFHEFSREFGTGHPSGANFFLAMDMSKYVNSFMWRGDPIR